MTEPRLLDTCVVSAFLHPMALKRHPGFLKQVEGVISTQSVYLSVITVFELSRGLRELELRGEGRRKIVRTRLFLKEAVVLSLDLGGGAAWKVAVELWATGRARSPSVMFSDADLLIAATAIANNLVLVTTDSRLAERLENLGFGDAVEVYPLQ